MEKKDITPADIRNDDQKELDKLIEDANEDSAPAAPPAAKPEEKKLKEEVEEVPADIDRTKPLNADIRFRQVIEERNRLREERRQWLEERGAAAPRRAEPEERKPAEPTDIPAWFVESFGPADDPRVKTAWQGFSAMRAEDRSAAKREAIDELKSEREAEQSVLDEAKAYVEDGIQALRDEHGDFDLPAFRAHMAKYPIVDAEGNLDLAKGYESYAELQAAKAKETSANRKKVASKVGEGNGGDAAPKSEGITSADIRKAERELGY